MLVCADIKLAPGVVDQDQDCVCAEEGNWIIYPPLHVDPTCRHAFVSPVQPLTMLLQIMLGAFTNQSQIFTRVTSAVKKTVSLSQFCSYSA